MAHKLINLTLPEWTWLSGGEHEKNGDPLEGRTVIYHVRSASVIEMFEANAYRPAEGVRTYNFNYRNIYGVVENHIAVLHYSAACDDPDILDEILQKASKWYCNYMEWEDRNIIADESSSFN